MLFIGAALIMPTNAYADDEPTQIGTYDELRDFITVSKAGTVKVNKKLKKGTYKIKVKVTVSETDIYASAVKTKTIKIKVK